MVKCIICTGVGKDMKMQNNGGWGTACCFCNARSSAMYQCSNCWNDFCIACAAQSATKKSAAPAIQVASSGTETHQGGFEFRKKRKFEEEGKREKDNRGNNAATTNLTGRKNRVFCQIGHHMSWYTCGPRRSCNNCSVCSKACIIKKSSRAVGYYDCAICATQLCVNCAEEQSDTCHPEDMASLAIKGKPVILCSANHFMTLTTFHPRVTKDTSEHWYTCIGCSRHFNFQKRSPGYFCEECQEGMCILCASLQLQPQGNGLHSPAGNIVLRCTQRKDGEMKFITQEDAPRWKLQSSNCHKCYTTIPTGNARYHCEKCTFVLCRDCGNVEIQNMWPQSQQETVIPVSKKVLQCQCGKHPLKGNLLGREEYGEIYCCECALMLPLRSYYYSCPGSLLANPDSSLSQCERNKAFCPCTALCLSCTGQMALRSSHQFSLLKRPRPLCTLRVGEEIRNESLAVVHPSSSMHVRQSILKSGVAATELCQVCNERVKCVVFSPCFHTSCCRTCATKITDCPICRIPVFNRYVIPEKQSFNDFFAVLGESGVERPVKREK